MNNNKAYVYNWRFENGQTCPNPGSEFPLTPPPRGWYCWAYPDDGGDFVQWMKNNCPTADCTYRFNSGDPMYTIFIQSEREAMLFQLKWI